MPSEHPNVARIAARCGIGCVFLAEVVLLRLLLIRGVVDVSETPIDQLVGVKVRSKGFVVPIAEGYVVLDDELALLCLRELRCPDDDGGGVLLPFRPMVEQDVLLCLGLLVVVEAGLQRLPDFVRAHGRDGGQCPVAHIASERGVRLVHHDGTELEHLREDEQGFHQPLELGVADFARVLRVDVNLRQVDCLCVHCINSLSAKLIKRDYMIITFDCNMLIAVPIGLRR